MATMNVKLGMQVTPEDHPARIAYNAITRAAHELHDKCGPLPMTTLIYFDGVQRMIRASAEMAGFDLQ